MGSVLTGWVVPASNCSSLVDVETEQPSTGLYSVGSSPGTSLSIWIVLLLLIGSETPIHPAKLTRDAQLSEAFSLNLLEWKNPKYMQLEKIIQPTHTLTASFNRHSLPALASSLTILTPQRSEALHGLCREVQGAC